MKSTTLPTAMGFIRLCRYVILPFACHVSLAVASPTSDDYVPCHKMASLRLTECLSNKSNANDQCWATVRSAHESCTADVNKSYQPDEEKIEAQKKAMDKFRQQN